MCYHLERIHKTVKSKAKQSFALRISVTLFEHLDQAVLNLESIPQ